MNFDFLKSLSNLTISWTSKKSKISKPFKIPESLNVIISWDIWNFNGVLYLQRLHHVRKSLIKQKIKFIEYLLYVDCFIHSIILK